jgi:site-specific DNA-methyltransferase (adenine-specific)
VRHIQLLLGDCLVRLDGLDPESVRAIISDPPYHIAFMGKKWDAEGAGIAFSQEFWSRAYKVLMPGGTVKAFSGTRTFHRMAAAMEDAGFIVEPWESLEDWMYGSGFPKSHNVAVYLDRMLTEGKSREIKRKGVGNLNGKFAEAMEGFESQSKAHSIKTEEASRFLGFGTALKPSWEPVVVGRKPA